MPNVKTIPNPYATQKVASSTYAVVYRYTMPSIDKISFKRVCAGCSENDAKLIAKLLNENLTKKAG